MRIFSIIISSLLFSKAHENRWDTVEIQNHTSSENPYLDAYDSPPSEIKAVISPEIYDSFFDQPDLIACSQSLMQQYKITSISALCLPEPQSVEFLEIFLENNDDREDLSRFPLDALTKSNPSLPYATHHSRTKLLKLLVKNGFFDYSDWKIKVGRENSEELDYLKVFLDHDPNLLKIEIEMAETWQGSRKLPLLEYALYHRRLKLVKLLLNYIPDLSTSKKSMGPLDFVFNWDRDFFTTSTKKALEITELLLQKNASLYRKSTPRTFMELAIFTDLPTPFLQLFVKYGAKLNYQDDPSHYSSSLIISTIFSDHSLSNSERILRFLISAGADINEPAPPPHLKALEAKKQPRRTPLGSLCYYGLIDVENTFSLASLLITLGADYTYPDRFGFTPIEHAIYYERVKIAKKLLTLLPAVDTDPKPIPLLEYVLNWRQSEKVRLEIIDLLLQKNASLYRREKPYTLLELAIMKGEVNVVRLLIQKSAKPNYRDDSRHYSTSPILYTLSKEQLNISTIEKIVDLLVAAGADINEGSPLPSEYAAFTDSLHRSPLNTFCYYTSDNPQRILDLVSLLLKKGADYHFIDSSGVSPWRNVELQHRKELLDLFQKFSKENSPYGTDLHIFSGIIAIFIIFYVIYFKNKKNNANSHRLEKKQSRAVKPKKELKNIENTINISKQEKLFKACKAGNITELEKINSQLDNDCNSLMIAVTHNNIDIVKYLLTIPDTQWKTSKNHALKISCKSENIAMVTTLLSHNPILNELIEDTNLLKELIDTCSDNIIKILLTHCLSKNPDIINFRWQPENDSLLMLLVRRGLSESVAYLIKNFTVDANARNDQAESALIISCQKGHADITRFLLKNFNTLKTSMPDSKNRDALYYALSSKKIPLAKELIQRGCELSPSLKKAECFVTLSKREQQDLLTTAGQHSNEEKKNIPPPSQQSSAPLKSRYRPRQAGTPKKHSSKNRVSSTSQQRSIKYKPLRDDEKKPTKSLNSMKFAQEMLTDLKNLSAFYLAGAVNPFGFFIRHCQIIAYMFAILTNAENYNRLIEKLHLDPQDRCLTNPTDYKSFRSGIGKRVLPYLLAGSKTKESSLCPITAVLDTAKELVTLFPRNKRSIDKSYTLFSEKQVAEIANILGTRLTLPDASAMKPFPITTTSLYKLIYNFHDTLANNIREDDKTAATRHAKYIFDFALPAIQELFAQLSDNAADSQASSDPRTKSAGIINWGIAHRRYEHFIHALILISASCGDLKAELFSTKPALYKFISTCRKKIRNAIMHRSGAKILAIEEKDLIELRDVSTQLAKTYQCTRVDWHKSPYGAHYATDLGLKSERHLVTYQALSEIGLFTDTSSKPGDTIFEYLAVERTGKEPSLLLQY